MRARVTMLCAVSVPAPDTQASNVVVNIDVFGGCVYHCYSLWFFYVLGELATPIVLQKLH
jgi:hypothetical protein